MLDAVEDGRAIELLGANEERPVDDGAPLVELEELDGGAASDVLLTLRMDVAEAVETSDLAAKEEEDRGPGFELAATHTPLSTSHWNAPLQSASTWQRAAVPEQATQPKLKVSGPTSAQNSIVVALECNVPSMTLTMMPTVHGWETAAKGWMAKSTVE